MKNAVLIILFGFGFILFTSCDKEHCNPVTAPRSISRTVEPNFNPEQSTLYTCMMHPEIKSHKHGKCPKCGMELVKI